MIIGILPMINTDPIDKQWIDIIHHGYYDLFDGNQIIVIPTKNNNPAFYADMIDRLVIVGGTVGDDVRAKSEYAMILQMKKRKKFVMGICHGSFVLTHLLGVDLCDVEKTYHDNLVEHDVYYKGLTQKVISYHIKGIKKLNPTGVSLVQDKDGLTEAWIDYKNNMCGILYHAERMASHWLPDEISSVMRGTKNELHI